MHYLRRAAERAGLAGQWLTAGIALRWWRALVDPPARGRGRGRAAWGQPLVVILDEAERDGLPRGIGAVRQRRVFGDLHFVF